MSSSSSSSLASFGSNMSVACLALYCMLMFSPWFAPTHACSSRSVPRPLPATSTASISATARTSSYAAMRPTSMPSTTTTTTTTVRPNITFPTYKCPATYDAWYCLNDATCFSVKIGESVMYNCECAMGFMGPRCEYKELDGSYLPKRPRPMLEKASIASGATFMLLVLLLLCLALYLRYSGNVEAKLHDSALGMAEEECDCCCCQEANCCGDANTTAPWDEYEILVEKLRRGGLLNNADKNKGMVGFFRRNIMDFMYVKRL